MRNRFHVNIISHEHFFTNLTVLIYVSTVFVLVIANKKQLKTDTRKRSYAMALMFGMPSLPIGTNNSIV